MVPTLAALARYPWSGHSALLGTVPRPWQATADVLAAFGRTPRAARAAYQAFVAAGVPLGRRPELQGGGRMPAVSQARAGIAYLWTEVFGRSGRALTAVLGIRPAAVYAAARRGRAEPTRWERLVARY